jgi:hypothetical protein
MNKACQDKQLAVRGGSPVMRNTLEEMQFTLAHPARTRLEAK